MCEAILRANPFVPAESNLLFFYDGSNWKIISLPNLDHVNHVEYASMQGRALMRIKLKIN